jgi:hypothetical protein
MNPSAEKHFFKAFLYCILIAFFFLGFNATAAAQTNYLKSELLKVTAASDSLNQKMPGEKLYLQFDKPYYAINDTIWFKAYLLKASFFTPSGKSGIVYVDIANDSNKVIKQYSFPLQNGLSWGNITLNDKEFTPGTYIIRAYTNWMRNFGDDYFFVKTFYVSSANGNNLLVDAMFNTSILKGNATVNARLLFAGMDNTPLAVKPFTLQVMNGNKSLYSQKIQTGVDGTLDINFNIPQKTNGLAIIAENEQKDKKAAIPVVLNRPDKADVQFLPEGGNLVAGLPAHLGFKVIGEDGKGLDVAGVITDHNQNQVAEFKSAYKGIGGFYFDVKENESYTAKISFPGGMTKDYPLPAVKGSGIVLQVRNPMESDSVTVSVAATNDIAKAGESYFLIGRARGIVCYAAVISFREGNYVKRRIAKNLFPSGITHFTLMTEKYLPINERLVFIDHHDNLKIKVVTDKAVYNKRDSVAIKLEVADKDGNPVKGDFSVAVTDDAQVKTDTLNNAGIVNHLLFASDLKGYVEGPGYYLQSATDETWQALDNLLLTQGWIGYDWEQVFSPPSITYQPESGFAVRGGVVNAFNKPVKGTDVLLFSKSPAILMDTATDQDGKFVFDHFPRVDTPAYIIRAVNKNGKSFNVRITIDEQKPAVFTKLPGTLTTPWYVNSDSTLISYTQKDALLQKERFYSSTGHLLKEVNIASKKTIKGSQNLNGTGNADIVLDEKDMEAAGKKNWLQLLQENIKGLRVAYVSKGIGSTFFSGNLPVTINSNYKTTGGFYIKDKNVIFVIDGILLTRSLVQQLAGISNDPVICLEYYFKSHSAEDIKGIEVNYSSKYNDTYGLRYHTFDAAFIEITTRSDAGPWVGTGATPGMYLYKPLPLSWPKQFYKPKYTVNDTANNTTDFRSTIDWEPNITTNARGEAMFSFFTAGKPSTYTVIIEGSDMNGDLGFKTDKLMINTNKTSPVINGPTGK